MSSDTPETNDPAQAYIHGIPLEAKNHGKCFSCGFLRLATPVRAGTHYREIEWPARWGMEHCLDRVQTDKEDSVQPMPECVIGFADLRHEIGQEAYRQRGDFERAAQVVFWQDRKCPKWRSYNPGKPVQQYYTEVFMQELEKLRQQFQEDWERRRQSWEERLAEGDRNRQLELAKSAEVLQAQRDEFATKITTGGIIIAAILGIAQILTLTNESLLWKIIAALYHLLSG